MNHRVFIEDGGKVKIYPPTREVVEPLMRQLGQDYHCESIRHPSPFSPLFQQTRRLLVGITIDESKKMTLDKLWQVHDSKSFKDQGISLLDLKIEICKRLYEKCEVCGHLCKVNRYQGKGKCRVGVETYYDYWGSLIGEESVINPAAGIALWGCPWNCSFCHASDYLNINNGTKEGKLLGPDIWKEIAYRNCQTIEFNAAGDPTPHLLSILNVLNQAPGTMNHPIVCSSNSHATQNAWKLLDGIADVFLVDIKFGNDSCAHSLAGCLNHNHFTKETLECLDKLPGKKIIRWLLLPGHVDCCGQEIVKMLSRHDFCVSLLDDFQDDHKMVFKRKNTENEIARAKELIKQYGLKDINHPENARHFWNK
jgi:putative pyruvate formate lyase activating enzyme